MCGGDGHVIEGDSRPKFWQDKSRAKDASQMRYKADDVLIFAERIELGDDATCHVAEGEWVLSPKQACAFEQGGSE